MSSATSLIVLLFCVYFATAHICLYDPKQRGPVDISGPSNTCYQPVGPCGKFGPEDPKVTLTAGQTFTFHFQQNLNHFSVGTPGYFDVALSKGVPPAGEQEKDSDFAKIDGFIPDYFAHAELKQTNMTYDMIVPEDAQCDHCVVRFRYITHKPGEPIFHQCVDVRIVKTNTVNKQEVRRTSLAERIKEALKPNVDASSNLFAIYYDPTATNKTNAKFARINTEEPIVEPIADLETIIRSYQEPYNNKPAPSFKAAINDGVVAYDPKERILYYTATPASGDMSDLKVHLMKYYIDSQKVMFGPELEMPASALHLDTKSGNLRGIFVQNSTKKAGYYEFVTFLINKNDGAVKVEYVTEPDNYYIDFVWSEFDSANGMMYILARNEHDPFNQTQKIIVIDVTKGVVDVFPLDYQHSFSSFHLRNGDLYAITQGVPFHQPTPFKFKLFKIRPKTRDTQFLFDLSIPNYQNWNGQVRHFSSSNLLYQIYQPTDSPKLSIYAIDVTNPSYQPTFTSCRKLSHVYNVIAL